MTYGNDVQHTDFITIEDNKVLKCFIKSVNIHISKLNYKVWTILRGTVRTFRNHLIHKNVNLFL